MASSWNAHIIATSIHRSCRMTSEPNTFKTVLVTGANGYIGRAVAQAFQRAGYTTLGLIRSSKDLNTLKADSIIPIIGSAADPEAVLSAVRSYALALDIIVSTTEDTSDYVPHFNDTVTLLRALAKTSSGVGTRPLVLFTSGSKDYGRSGLDGGADLVMQDENSSINPPPFLAARATHATKVLNEADFDAAVLRPTHVHGHGSSYLALFFDTAAAAKREGKALRLQADPRTILHSVNVDDCGEAYVALANHPDRSQVAGQCFNISAGKRYETVGSIADALILLYGIKEGLAFDPPDPARLDDANPLLAFSQWVGSEKIRKLTGWRDGRPMFAEGLSQYRQEYEKGVVIHKLSTIAD